MTEQLPGLGEVDQFAEPELRFIRRWRELIDKAGGQARVVNRLGWTRSTVSRDYRGEIPPSDERLRQLCDYLGLRRPERDEMLRLLEQARHARQARKGQSAVVTPLSRAAGDWVPGNGATGNGVPGPGPATAAERLQGVSTAPPRPDHARPRSRNRRKAAVLIGAGMLAGVILAVAALLAGWWRPTAATEAPTAQGSFTGLGIKAVAIAKSSLPKELAGALGQGKMAAASTVDGYVFRNMDGPSLCLTAADPASTAGQQGDRVEVATCDDAASQVWIPEQWEINGTRFTWLVNDRYQTKCLNANNIGGLANGRRTQLWNCYKSPNEYWDFGDWFAHVKTGGHAYPIFVESARFCLDADKYDFRDGDSVNLWSQYPAANQFWS